jgi:DNA adenine methylase
LQNTTLVTGDFENALDLAQGGDFVYMDPPYSVASCRVFNEYTPAPFSKEDITRLRVWMDRLTDLGIEFLVSYADCQESKDLRKDYEYRMVFTRRHIAGFVSKRKEIAEVMISNRKRVKGTN